MGSVTGQLSRSQSAHCFPHSLSTPAHVTHRHPCLCATREPAPSQSMAAKKSIPFMPNLEVLRLDKGDKKGRCGGCRVNFRGAGFPGGKVGLRCCCTSFPCFLPDHFYKISRLNHHNAKFCVKEKRCPKHCKTQNTICSDF